MFLPLELLSIIVILLFVFLDKKLSDKQKRKRIWPAILIWLIIQIILIVSGALIVLFAPKKYEHFFYDLSGPVNTFSIFGFILFVVSISMSLVFSKKIALKEEHS
jgi:ATP/ADP translocase